MRGIREIYGTKTLPPELSFSVLSTIIISKLIISLRSSVSKVSRVINSKIVVNGTKKIRYTRVIEDRGLPEIYSDIYDS